MPFAITLNGDGTEAFREECDKASFPKNGFERRGDGNFYKQLGDPRCISDTIKKDEIEAKNFSGDLVKIDSADGVDLSYAMKPDESNYCQLDEINYLVAPEQLSYDLVLQGCRPNEYEYSHKSKTSIYNATLSSNFGLKELKLHDVYAKIEVCPRDNEVRFWFANPNKNSPDLIVLALVHDKQTAKENC